MVRLTKKLIEEVAANPNIVKDWDLADIARLLEKADKAYHSDGTPLFDDSIYDVLKTVYEKKSKSMYAKVGAPVSKQKVELPYFMGSMDKIKGDDKDIANFKNKNSGNRFVVEDKLDGVSSLLYVKDGSVSLFTRGDGTVGQNITKMLAHINGIPDFDDLINVAQDYDGEVTIRGELIMTKEGFEAISDKGANARNLVSGAVNAKVPDDSVCKHIGFVGYTVLHPMMKPSKQMSFMSKLGLDVVDSRIVLANNLTSDVLSNILIGRREKSPYEVDGIIVIEDEEHEHVTGKNPPFAFAFKHIITQESAEVIVTNVEWNVSKDGYMIPVVEFDGVKLAGVTVKRATGFNADYIHTHVIGPGARIIVTRSGDVIPYIISILSAASSGQPQMPNVDYEWTSSGKDIIQSGDSDELELKKLESFFNKLDVPGMRKGTLTKLYNAGFDTIIKIINISETDLLGIDGFKEKSANNLLASIKEKLSALSCIELMDASNAFGRGFAKKRIEMITDRYPAIVSSNYIPTIEELTDVDGVSEITAKAFIAGLPKYRSFVKEVKLVCVDPYKKKKKQPKKLITGVFADHIVVFTGFRNAGLKSYIENESGKVSDTITKATTILITKEEDSTSSKAEKARKNDVIVLSLEQFTKKFNVVL